MNADIVYTLCSYLDLGSLFSLAAAYPSWSAMILQYMRNKKLKVQLFLECDERVETLKAKPLNAFELRTCVSHVLPKYVWKEVPSCPLDISKLCITQKDFSAISEDAYALLAKITTSDLDLNFCRRSEARRLLRTIPLKPPSRLSLNQLLLEPDKRVLSPFIKPSEQLRKDGKNRAC